jgi:hypothetical protein
VNDPNTVWTSVAFIRAQWLAMAGGALVKEGDQDLQLNFQGPKVHQMDISGGPSEDPCPHVYAMGVNLGGVPWPMTGWPKPC